MTPTLIITNAMIATGDQRRPWVTALAVDGSVLTAMGSAAEIQKLAVPTTRVINAEGRSLALPDGVVVGSHVQIEVSQEGAVTNITISGKSA